MAKSHPEKYNPGDLDKTRSNLGNLSKEEADRMAEILGGEVGVEKVDENLKKRYDHLKASTVSRPSGSRAAAKKPASGYESIINKGTASHSASTNKKTAKHDDRAYTGHYTRKKKSVKKLSYLERIKIDRMAAKPEHNVKTKAAVISTYFSFLVKNRDKLNPEFIINGETYYYSHIEALVTNLKSLLKQVNPSIFRNYVNPYYRSLLKILISWDLSELSSRLTGLQKSPRNREVSDCAELCREIYTPIIRAGDSDLKYLNAAVDRLYKVLMIVFSEEPEELLSIKERWLETKEKLKIVFRDVAYTCYPLLLKLTGSKFYYYREFMKKNTDLIIEFLNIDKNDIATAPESLEKLGKQQYTLSHLKAKLEKEREQLQEKLKPGETERNESEISKSLELLEQLFPESNWKRLGDFPDFFPYFQPLFKFPKGSELIASEDPLQQVVVLAAIIQDLLYGFRSVKIKSESQTDIDSTVDRWHLFIDEMIQKNYNKLLIEYCRNIEKGIEYSASKFGQKLLTDIYWFKRRFILPHMKFKILYRSESIPLKASKFHEQVGTFFKALHSLLEEFDNSNQRQSVIENYNAPFYFDIKNITSYRLQKVLAKENIAPTNENLIRYTHMLVSLLDFLINSTNSPYYKEKTEEIPIYRYDPIYQGKPQYSVPLIETETLLKKY